MKKKLLPLAIAIVVFAAFTFFIPKESLTLALNNHVLTVTHVTKTSSNITEDEHTEIDLSQVKSITLEENIVLGEMQDGVATRRCSCGTWKNDAYGSYQLYVYNNVNQYIVIERQVGEPIFVNLESKAMTKSFYDALVNEI